MAEKLDWKGQLAATVVTLSQFAGAVSSSAIHEKIAAGRAAIRKRLKDREYAAYRRKIIQIAQPLIVMLSSRWGVKCGEEGTTPGLPHVDSSTAAAFESAIVRVFPAGNEPPAGFPIREIAAAIAAVVADKQLTEEQGDALRYAARAVLKASSSLAGTASNATSDENGSQPGPEPVVREQPSPDHPELPSSDSADDSTAHSKPIKAPSRVAKSKLRKLPEAIRTATGRIRRNPFLPTPESHELDPQSVDALNAWRLRMDEHTTGLGSRYCEYCEACLLHQHTPEEAEKAFEWLVQLPVAPPMVVQALLAEQIVWRLAKPKSKKAAPKAQ